MINTNQLNSNYVVRKLNDKDIQDILNIYCKNSFYFKCLGIKPNVDTVLDDMTSLPKGKEIKDKYLVGYYDNEKLIGVIDLIDGYPDKDTVYIGLFILDVAYQSKGIGTKIFNEIKDNLKKMNYTCIKLAYLNSNEKAKSFWQKLGFKEDGKTSKYLNKDITELSLTI